MTTTIRDNVHGDILIADDVIYDLINTTEFQRLKRINQLGGGQHVFIGATHNRFAHCIGVYHLVSRFLENKNITSVAPFSDEKNRLTVKVAGLLHDIGHGPFSHSFEKVGTTKINHEHYSSAIINDKTTEVNQVLIKHNIDPVTVAKIIEGKNENNLLNLLVSSQLDADRLDYLLRDSVNAGVTYSKVDVDWIVRHAQIRDGRMVFPMKVLYAIESYLLGRYYMYNQVYCHKTSRAFDETLHTWFKRFSELKAKGFEFKFESDYEIIKPLFEGKEFDVRNYLELDDYSFTEIIKKTIDESDEILSDFGNRLLNRKFYEAINVNDDQIEEYKAKVIAEGLDPEYYFISGEEPGITIYSNSGKKDEGIYFIDQSGKVVEITEVSSIINNELVNQKNKKIIFIPKN